MPCPTQSSDGVRVLHERGPRRNERTTCRPIGVRAACGSLCETRMCVAAAQASATAAPRMSTMSSHLKTVAQMTNQICRRCAARAMDARRDPSRGSRDLCNDVHAGVGSFEKSIFLEDRTLPLRELLTN